MDGYKVMMACRNVTAGHEAMADIVRENPDACVECCALDLASFSSVRAFAKNSIGSQSVSAVVHNAGVMAPPFITTVDGHELTFQVNHLAPFYLTELLLPNMRKAHKETGEASRVVLVASGTHRWATSRGRGAAGGLASGAGVASRGEEAAQRHWTMKRWGAYAGSKLCNVLYAAELTKRYWRREGDDGGGQVWAVAVRPGTVRTNIVRHSLLMRLLFAVANPLLTSTEKAGEILANAVLNPEIVPGSYYDQTTPKPASAAARDSALQAALWEVSKNVLVSDGDLQCAVEI